MTTQKLKVIPFLNLVKIDWILKSIITDGKFGAYMQVHIQNDGPVTIELESPIVEPKAKSKPVEISAVDNQTQGTVTCENGEKL